NTLSTLQISQLTIIKMSKIKFTIFIIGFLFLTQTSSLHAQTYTKPCPLTGDTNNCDGIVNVLDFSFLSTNIGTSNSKADIRPDGTINILDFNVLSTNFGAT